MNIIEYVCHGVAGCLGHALDVQRVQQRCCEIQPDHCYQTILIVAVHTITVLGVPDIVDGPLSDNLHLTTWLHSKHC